MKGSAIKTMALAVLSGALVAGTALPATAELRPRGTLKISIKTDGGTKTVRLACDPDGGTHPKPKVACDLLRKVKGKPARLRKDDVICTKEYMPHKVRVAGTWRGRKIFFMGTFDNACLMKAAGGALYSF
ncbi:SSI family serine proteinase inhibitor [Nonomuraea typhae]|uniref:SSI family serine proteinase inhibitor n=1 Tax=Nonomuraea typhae TaxID=2603600 RepID=UPI0012FC1796|nr:SSI family serine proteinase inhibitor [Nonomuraea typhae]